MKKLIVIAVFINILVAESCIYAQSLSREQMIEDTREMVSLIEECHPDPYLKIGGKLVFHRELQNLVNSYPDEGMEIQDFWWKLMSFTAFLKDGHTYLMPVKYPDPGNPGGIPMKFKVLADSCLAVQNVCGAEYSRLIGARVRSIQGKPISELLSTVKDLYPSENTFDKFRHLKTFLWYSDYLEHLLPGWQNGNPIAIELETGKNDIELIALDTGEGGSYKSINNQKSALILPGTDKCDFVFKLFDNKDIAYIRIDKQDEFREYAEQSIAGLSGISDKQTLQAYRNQYLSVARQWYTRYHGGEAPDSLELIINELPSFSDFMQRAVCEMKSHGARNLIIDLRSNRGGISLLSDILIYYLHGAEKLNEIKNDGYSITYLSEPAVRIVPSINPEVLNQSGGTKQSYLLSEGDYDFSDLEDWENGKNAASALGLNKKEYSTTLTFYREISSGAFSAHYTPANVYVIVSDNTFSAGYETAIRLKKCGAKVVGVPPAQSGNCFGMAIYPVEGLRNSGIKLNVSIRKIVEFPDDPISGYQIKPDIELDYSTFRKYSYDQNASVMMVLDRVK